MGRVLRKKGERIKATTKKKGKNVKTSSLYKDRERNVVARKLGGGRISGKKKKGRTGGKEKKKGLSKQASHLSGWVYPQNCRQRRPSVNPRKGVNKSQSKQNEINESKK